MFKDTIEILEFTIDLIKNKQVKKNPAIEVYDIYRHLHIMKRRMNLVIKFMEKDWRNYNTNTQHGSSMKKWVVFVNQDLHEYVDSKYMLFCKILKLEKGSFMYKGVLTLNFLHKTLNCKANKYFDFPNFDNEMTFTNYSFNFHKLEQRDYRYSDIEIDRDSLWSKSITALQDDTLRNNHLANMRSDVDKIDTCIAELETFLQENFTVQDMLVREL